MPTGLAGPYEVLDPLLKVWSISIWYFCFQVSPDVTWPVSRYGEPCLNIYIVSEPNTDLLRKCLLKQCALCVHVVIIWEFLLFCCCLEIFFVVMFCSEFQEFVRNQETCRKRWHETQTALSHLKTSLAEKEQENVALQTKLKHARWVFCPTIMHHSKDHTMSVLFFLNGLSILEFFPVEAVPATLNLSGEFLNYSY